jgi:hypothetical protein
MKELTIEQKAKAYDEAIQRGLDYIRHTPATEMVTRQDIFEAIFPEFKEPEDEKLRKEMLQIAKESEDSFYMVLTPNKRETLIAWLEKQGDKSQGKSAYEAINEETVDNSNKVEPRFHEGDWIVQGCNILKIRCVVHEYYCFETVGGYVDDMLVSEIDSLYHLWTIKDVKEGDVLVTESGKPFIFKGCLDKLHPNSPVACCGIDSNDNFYAGFSMNRWTDGKVYPAIIEQHELLFRKMKESNYEWDANKKELIKL